VGGAAGALRVAVEGGFESRSGGGGAAGVGVAVVGVFERGRGGGGAGAAVGAFERGSGNGGAHGKILYLGITSIYPRISANLYPYP